MLATIGDLETLLLFFALLMIVFATVIFLVNSYQVFSQQAAQSADDYEDSEEEPLWSRPEIVAAYDFAGQQRREKLDRLQEDPIDETDLFEPVKNSALNNSNNVAVRQRYYPNSAELQAARASSSGPKNSLLPVLGATILVTAVAAAVAGYWHQKR